MSTNLHLSNRSETCSLLQTPTNVTNQILNRGVFEDSSYVTMLRYFEYAAKILSAGALLDHKLEVAMFLVKNPDARWSALDAAGWERARIGALIAIVGVLAWLRRGAPEPDRNAVSDAAWAAALEAREAVTAADRIAAGVLDAIEREIEAAEGGLRVQR